MATSFQPEHPHPDAKTTTSSTSVIAAAVISALMVVMLLAIVVPRWFGDGTVNWLVTIGGGLVTLLIVLAIGFLRR